MTHLSFMGHFHIMFLTRIKIFSAKSSQTYWFNKANMRENGRERKKVELKKREREREREIVREWANKTNKNNIRNTQIKKQNNTTDKENKT